MPGNVRRTVWMGLPLVVVVAIGIGAHYDPKAWQSEASARRSVLRMMSLDELPRVERSSLQMMLVSHRRLPGADLRAQDLHAMSLRDKTLAGAQLLLADLHMADLSGVDLRGADLRAVTAAEARLRRADLRHADLRCANLEGADLRRARLGRARLRGAVADDATRWPAGFRLRGRGITDEQTISQSSDVRYSFHGYAWDCLRQLS